MANTTTDGNKYRSIVTDKGKEKIAAATLTGEKVNIIYAAVGDGGGEYVTPSPVMTGLVNEVWRGGIAYEQINPESKNMIDVKVAIPADIGGFTVREAGFFDSEGDMVAVCNIPATEKVVISAGASGTLTLLIHIVFTDADTVEFTIDPTLDSISEAEAREIVREHNESETAHEGIFAKVTSLDFTIPASGWDADTDTAGEYALCIDIPSEHATADLVPILTVLPEGQRAAKECGMCSAARTVDGALRVYAQEPPAEDIPCSLTLVSTG